MQKDNIFYDMRSPSFVLPGEKIKKIYIFYEMRSHLKLLRVLQYYTPDFCSNSFSIYEIVKKKLHLCLILGSSLKPVLLLKYNIELIFSIKFKHNSD